MSHLYELIRSTEFLGPEFLTWLWFHHDTRDAAFARPGGGTSFYVLFDDRMLVSASWRDAPQSLFRGGAPAASEEARVALRQGRHVAEARLRIVSDDREWAFSIRAADLHVRGLTIPAVLSPRDDEALAERLALIEEFEDLLSAAYRTFLEARTSERWAREEWPAFEAWRRGEDRGG